MSLKMFSDALLKKAKLFTKLLSEANRLQSRDTGQNAQVGLCNIWDSGENPNKLNFL